jgi:hypothetical protein
MDRPAQRRLRHMAGPGRLGKIPVLGHGNKIFQRLQGHNCLSPFLLQM